MTKLCTRYAPRHFLAVKTRGNNVYVGSHPITAEQHFLETEKSGLTHMVVDGAGECVAECASVSEVLTHYLSLEILDSEEALFVVPLKDITDIVKR